MTDILLDETDDLRIENGDFVIGESLDQEVSLIIRLNTGELKEDPVLGPNLIRMIKSNISQSEIKKQVKNHLSRDSKDYEVMKDRIILNRK